ncbi:alanine/glycine:cation symporter family protein [Halarsenatibacter silvermanii]|uniref:Alanine or glycine:cation symporter, AGCS family n=1 Tax=Halarsenatibacter silvermanii TaxID=321763 RepID=A0A1G9Q0E0_9FIRM|nr:sodium:alanine symporter family protein [Halarsenatibacter silvermanii]SDM04466.1 alanine or glycine:cation symporter, AGCS family [Halarsenatibacter silvermanii]
MLDFILNINDVINEIVWGPPFIIFLLGTGLYLTIRLDFFQFTHFGLSWRESFGRYFSRAEEKEGGVLSSFQAISSAMAATLGVGNIAGVSTALALGGPGAVFWMWISALVGMATKFGEAALGIKYREKVGDGFSGGVMYYIKNGMGEKWNWLALLYAFLAGVAALGIGNMVQSNTLAEAARDGFAVPEYITGVVVVFFVALVILGGIKRIGRVAERLVPIMAVFYIIGAIIILILNITEIPAAFADIFRLAFSPAPAAGGFAGATVRMTLQFGVARGIFSNEAGLGAASIVHAQAKNKPTRQGMWGIWEVFIDTIIVGTMTALVVLVTDSIPTGETGVVLATEGFTRGLPGPGGYIINISIIVFAYTTMLTWSFYGEESWRYIFGKKAVMPYRFIFLIFLFIGAVGALEPIWLLADTLNGLMAAPNLIALIFLAKKLAQEKDDYLVEHKQSA